jgi:hypothetical protein
MDVDDRHRVLAWRLVHSLAGRRVEPHFLVVVGDQQLRLTDAGGQDQSTRGSSA